MDTPEPGPAAVAKPPAGYTVAPEAKPAVRVAESPRPEPALAARTQAAAPLPEESVASAPRNVELKFSLDDGRVQIHVAERAGDVHVAVHTQDSNLAGALRQDLPQLASRLEQTGFHAETWHGPAAGQPDGMSAGEPSQGAPQQDTPSGQQHQPGGHQHHQQQREETPEETAPATPVQDFSWLFDSLQTKD